MLFYIIVFFDYIPKTFSKLEFSYFEARITRENQGLVSPYGEFF